MAANATITRRAAIVGALASSAALAVPAAASVQTPIERVNDLARQLADALAAVNGDDWLVNHHDNFVAIVRHPALLPNQRLVVSAGIATDFK